MSLAVHVSAVFFDQVVEETFAPRGVAVTIGGSGAMALPVPEGVPYLAKLEWRGQRVVTVQRPDGSVSLLEGDNVVGIDEGPIRLEIRLIDRYPLRRLPYLATALTSVGGVALLMVPLVGVLGLVPSQLGAVNQAWCATWLGDALPPEAIPIVADLMEPCRRSSGAADPLGGDHRIAEYLERVLKKDFDGEDRGALAKDGDRQHGEKEVRDFYMPAGDKGPPKRLGGAQEVELRPQRYAARPKEPDVPTPPKQDTPLSVEGGTPIELPEFEPIDDTTTEVVFVEDPADDDAETQDRNERRAEDREGWGFRDWYDQKQLDEDRQRIEMMTDLAQRMVRIDPDDPAALSLLAFYQYLNEDHEAAKRTYDRYIELYPESAMGYNNKALAYKRQGRYVEEEALYRIALALPGDHTTTLNNLAVNLAHQKRFDEALAIMDDLARRDPDEPYAHLHRAKIYAEMGDEEKAMHFLELSLEGMAKLGTMHSIEFRQDIRLDPSFDRIRNTRAFRELLWQYYGDDTPLPRD
jgi:tetratricopeptide (TPR) repeat protein